MEKTHTVLERTNFQGAILDGADLRGVNLRDAEGLTPAQLAAAVVDHTTIPPVGWPEIAAIDAFE